MTIAGKRIGWLREGAEHTTGIYNKLANDLRKCQWGDGCLELDATDQVRERLDNYCREGMLVESARNILQKR